MYFQLKLYQYLSENHPEKLHFPRFIKERAALAAQAYSDAIKHDATTVEADELAMLVLFRGLHFSPFQTLLEVLQKEFAYDVPLDAMTNEVLELLEACLPVFQHYELGDDYFTDERYTQLYTELVGTIQLMLEEGLGNEL
ncbi:MAG: DUF1896 family protein [Mangrovibacterium sp.]